MKDAKITFRLSDEEKQKLEAIAKIKDIPVAQFIREAIRKEIESGNSSKLENNNN
jgi:predicted DNA-binding protein